MTPRVIQTEKDERVDGESPAFELIEALSDLRDVIRRLCDSAERKLAAMRRAAASELLALASEERELLGLHQQADARRRAAFARCAQALRLKRGALPRISEIAARLPAAEASRLLAIGEGLRSCAEKLRESNARAARVARVLHGHLEAVFAEVAATQLESVGYGPDGSHERRRRQLMVDAVG